MSTKIDVRSRSPTGAWTNVNIPPGKGMQSYIQGECFGRQIYKGAEGISAGGVVRASQSFPRAARRANLEIDYCLPRRIIGGDGSNLGRRLATSCEDVEQLCKVVKMPPCQHDAAHANAGEKPLNLHSHIAKHRKYTERYYRYNEPQLAKKS
ncbi:MAG: hypothetical protein Q3986_08160 [Akkermansia sp.]|nr:hypothetical protein [Akkermansia sp.]